MFLARKITRAKWEPKQDFADGEIPADAVTADLRTQGNSLSLWQCGDATMHEVEEAALALATAGNQVDKLDIVWLSDGDLHADGQNWVGTEGRTPVTDLIRRHVDLSLLDYARLGKIAHRIVAAMEEGRYIRLTRRRVTDLIATAVRRGRVELDDLEEKVRNEVSKSLARTEE